MSVSIIIPNRDNPSELEKTLSTILDDDKLLKEKYEIIFANDGDRDDIEKLIKKYKDKGIVIYSVKIPISKGSYYARNQAAKSALGDFIIFFDSGLRVSSNWFKYMKPFLKKHEYIGGEVKTEKKEKLSIGERFDMLYSFPMKTYINKFHFAGGGYLIIKRELFEKLGGFNDILYSGGDAELGLRVYNMKIKQYFFDKAPAYHPPRNFRQRFFKLIRVFKGRYDIYRLNPENNENPIGKSFFRILGGSFKAFFEDVIFFKKNYFYKSGHFSLFEYFLGIFIFRFVSAFARIYVKVNSHKIINT